MTIASTKPYLVRAIHEWCLDQGFTPHIAVMVGENVVVPPGYAQDGQIVLNLGPEATHNLVMGNERVTFQARFGGVSHALSIPVGSIIAVYARENGQGMAFELETVAEGEGDDDGESASTPRSSETTDSSSDGDDGSGGDSPGSGNRGSHLKVVK